MPRGAPDYRMYELKETELGAFDRRGDVVLFDDFEDNINKWWIVLSRAGASITLSNDTARNGGSSCKIVTGDVIDDEEQMSRYLSYPVLSKLGFEAHFSLHEKLSHISLIVLLDDGVRTFWAGLRYLPPTDVLQYYTGLPLWTQLVAGLRLYPMVQCFNAFKMVADFKNGVYSHFIVGQNTYPMTQAIVTTGTLLTPNSLGINIVVGTSVADNLNCYVDDVIVTQNEP